MDRFTEAYIECALWSSLYGENGEHTLDEYEGEVADATLAQMYQDCANFQKENAAELEEAYNDWRRGGVAYNEERAGHDFWLTRCGHGAGFWDRGLGEVGERLSKAARAYGTIDLYIGDDGKIYGA